MILKLKEVCKARKITLAEVAKRLKIKRETLSRSINGNISLNRLNDIARILNVPVTELIAVESNGLTGFVEYQGEIYRIQSEQDLEKLLSLVKST